MIVEIVVRVVIDTLTFLLGLLPQDTIDWPPSVGVADFLGKWVGPLDAIAPVSEAVAVLVPTVLVVMPVLIAARLTLFIYFLLPVIK